MTSQKPLPIHLHIHQAGTWRAYALPFAHIRQFSVPSPPTPPIFPTNTPRTSPKSPTSS
jgi:hypothetical protein